MPNIREYTSNAATAGFRPSETGAEAWQRASIRIGNLEAQAGQGINSGMRALSHVYNVWENQGEPPSGPDGSAGVANLDKLSQGLGGSPTDQPGGTNQGAAGSPLLTPESWASSFQRKPTDTPTNPLQTWGDFFHKQMGGQ